MQTDSKQHQQNKTSKWKMSTRKSKKPESLWIEVCFEHCFKRVEIPSSPDGIGQFVPFLSRSNWESPVSSKFSWWWNFKHNSGWWASGHSTRPWFDLNAVRDVLWTETMQWFVDVTECFKTDPFTDRQPVQFVQKWCYMGWTGLPENEANTFILKFLKSFEILFGDVIKQNIAVVQFWENNWTNNITTCISVNETSDAVDIPDVPIYRLWKLSYVIWHGHVLIKHHPEIANGVGLRNFSVTNQQGQMVYSATMIWRTRNKKTPSFPG